LGRGGGRVLAGILSEVALVLHNSICCKKRETKRPLWLALLLFKASHSLERNQRPRSWGAGGTGKHNANGSRKPKEVEFREKLEKESKERNKPRWRMGEMWLWHNAMANEEKKEKKKKRSKPRTQWCNPERKRNGEMLGPSSQFQLWRLSSLPYCTFANVDFGKPNYKIK